ncbi:MAG TPA: hypothetical protein VIY10_12095, partial [Solirubrobacteraceae bacterium]
MFAGDNSGNTGIVLASAQDGAEGHGGSASDAGPMYEASPNPKPFVRLPEPGLISSDPLLGAILFVAGAGEVGAVTDEAGSVSFFEGTSYSEKVLQQLQGAGEFHSFPESVSAFESSGTLRSIVGGDGSAYQSLEIPGSYSTATGTVYDGTFQFIKDGNGVINHRLFVP